MAPNQALQPMPGDRRGRSEGVGRARLSFYVSHPMPTTETHSQTDAPLPPTFFEALIALARLVNIEELQPTLYERHNEILNHIFGFTTAIASQIGPLRTTWALALSPLLPISQVAAALEAPIYSGQIPEFNIEWIEKQAHVLLPYALLVVDDREFPASLEECREVFHRVFPPYEDG